MFNVCFKLLGMNTKQLITVYYYRNNLLFLLFNSIKKSLNKAIINILNFFKALINFAEFTNLVTLLKSKITTSVYHKLFRNHSLSFGK